MTTDAAIVLDASAIIALLRDEVGSDVVEREMLGAGVRKIHALNLAEVYYAMRKEGSTADALQAVGTVRALDVSVTELFDEALWQRAAELKHHLLSKHRTRAAFADCICAAFAEREGATVITSDHGEFDPLVADGICKVQFIR